MHLRAAFLHTAPSINVHVQTLFHPQLCRLALSLAQSHKHWEVRLSEEDASGDGGQVEGVAVTPLMKFKDDWVVRVRMGPAGAGSSLVDMRSKSRVGKGDMGTNARRIKEFLNKLQEAGKKATPSS